MAVASTRSKHSSRRCSVFGARMLLLHWPLHACVPPFRFSATHSVQVTPRGEPLSASRLAKRGTDEKIAVQHIQAEGPRGHSRNRTRIRPFGHVSLIAGRLHARAAAERCDSMLMCHTVIARDSARQCATEHDGVRTTVGSAASHPQPPPKVRKHVQKRETSDPVLGQRLLRLHERGCRLERRGA